VPCPPTRPSPHDTPTHPLHPRSKQRTDSIQELRWTHRTPPEHLRANLSPLELQYSRQYDRLLSKYMRSGKGGVGLDLTAVSAAQRSPSYPRGSCRCPASLASQVGSCGGGVPSSPPTRRVCTRAGPCAA
jgi:hypothetical protein